MKDLKITHLLDPMHIIGNVYDAIIDHLFGENEKTQKRKENARRACKVS